MTNDEIFSRREKLYNELPGPRVGDYIKLKDSTYLRITYLWPETAQTIPEERKGSYYLGNGHISYSGTLNPGVKRSLLIPTDETRPGQVWFFKNDFAVAFNGIDYTMLFRVFTLTEE